MQTDLVKCRAVMHCSIFKGHLLVLAGSFVESTEHIMEENTARLAVNIITIGSFPKLLQVICILHNLKVQIIAVCETKKDLNLSVFHKGGNVSGYLSVRSACNTRHKTLFMT